MSKPFDYSKWDKIELSDDEGDCHPNIDKESWFRMKHRSRVEREETEEKDKINILKEMEKANQRIKQIQYDLKKLNEAKEQNKNDDDSDDDDDIDLDDREALQMELNELLVANQTGQTKLDEYEKNKKWNVDNMFEIKQERTIVNPNAGKDTFTPSGFAVEKIEKDDHDTTTTTSDELLSKKVSELSAKDDKKDTEVQKTTTTTKTKSDEATASVTKKSTGTTSSTTSSSSSTSKVTHPVGPVKPPSMDKPTPSPHEPIEVGAFETYHQFTERHAGTVEEFMQLKTLEESKNFLLLHGNVLLQENASNYLLLASLEDEMNGYREKMKLTARQSQIITNIAELAKTLKTHPGNVIQPFFKRLEIREPLTEFVTGVDAFVQRIIQRAVVKRAEIDEERRREIPTDGEPRDLQDIPIDERLGPGGLDPVEVIQTLPIELQEAFESRDVDELRNVLEQMDPKEAEYHMKRCIDSGLWVAGGGN